MLDDSREDNYVFNFKLSKYVGLYQVLSPDTATVFGRNVYHVAIVSFAALMLAVSLLFPVGLYHLMNDMTAFILYIGCIDNFVFSCCKVINILYYVRDIWACVEVTSFDFMRYPRYDRRLFRKWRRLCVHVTYICSSLTFFALVCWNSSPLVLNDTIIRIRNHDGTYNRYRLNVFNVYVMASESAYNRHFNAYFALETVIGVCFTYFTVIFDIFMITMCFALTCQLETICDAIRSLGHASAKRLDDHEDEDEEDEDEEDDERTSIDKAATFESKRRVHDDLRQILSDHQNVMSKLRDYYNMVRNITLSQIFVASSSHVFIWFIAAMSFDGGEARDSILSIKLFIVLPVFTFQLFMTCVLFGTINDKKDEMVFALYSSNWTEMDMESKKMILCAMNLNNANKLKLKFTDTKIVNLEMFSHTMRLCYSIFSMLINYNKNKQK